MRQSSRAPGEASLLQDFPLETVLRSRGPRPTGDGPFGAATAKMTSLGLPGWRLAQEAVEKGSRWGACAVRYHLATGAARFRNTLTAGFLDRAGKLFRDRTAA